MNLWGRVKSIDFLKFIQFGFLLCQKPLLIFPIWKATRQTLRVCEKLYGNAHHGRGKANAFRHALWNFLISQKTLKFTKNARKSAFWTEKVVDFYEKVTKNNLFDQKMDLHNNTFGRMYFLTNFDQNEAKTIDFLQYSAKIAQKVAKIEELELVKGKLVYITE